MLMVFHDPQFRDRSGLGCWVCRLSIFMACVRRVVASVLLESGGVVLCFRLLSGEVAGDAFQEEHLRRIWDEYVLWRGSLYGYMRP